MLGDFNDNYKDLTERIQKNTDAGRNESKEAIVCNLAIHYAFGSIDSVRNFTSLCQAIATAKSTQVSITCMFGDRVNKLFVDNKIEDGESWNSYQNEIKKFSIKKLYTGDKLTKVGQKIGVMLPFSEGEYYEEYAVNTQTLIDEFKAKGNEIS